MQSSSDSRQAPTLLRVLIGLGLDYVRWTQFVPMIMAWAFLLLMVGAMLLTNFQQQSFELIESGIGLYERIAGPVEPASVRPAAGEPAEVAPAPATRDGQSTTFTGDDLKSLIVKVWGVLALAGWVLGMVWRLLFGRRARWSLKRRLLVTALAGVACTGVMLFAYAFGSETFHGPFAQWLLLFVGAPLIVWCVSAWSLSVSTLISAIKRRIYGAALPTG